MATVRIEIRNDANALLGGVNIDTTDAILTKIDEWRLEQKNPDDTLKFANSLQLLRWVLRDFFKAVIGNVPTPAIQAEIDKILAAELEIARLKAEAAT